jgi:hypothetical protein
MNFELLHQDATGQQTKSIESISFLAFVKHATFAGFNHRFFPALFFRYPSIFFEFVPLFYGSDYFRLIPELASDPTETAYISNRIGRAFADFLSKKIYGAKFTHSYECAMELKGFPISGRRPDFYCDTLKKQFTVEAKGFSARSVSNSEMNIHKEQSTTGPLKRNFTVASVAYNLYRSPKVKFFDPEGDDALYDDSLNEELRNLYYRAVLNFVESGAARRQQSEFVDYFAYDFSYPYSDVSQILLHKAIVERSWSGVEWLNSIEQKNEINKEVYIDVDGIGLVGCANQRWLLEERIANLI